MPCRHLETAPLGPRTAPVGGPLSPETVPETEEAARGRFEPHPAEHNTLQKKTEARGGGKIAPPHASVISAGSRRQLESRLPPTGCAPHRFW
ncbi:hypothetical protein Pla111_22410 [Botrimarina hoheduenensis]|uniref:Uncharacterized protein n=1 Tax=Botrimarina hoheduenensis TaxID=2528000 RepID=A0A5C5VXW3_9BACT|nr:hypothetical protein Pla111_22410 [Botrimarina hoheduenensis]